MSISGVRTGASGLPTGEERSAKVGGADLLCYDVEQKQLTETAVRESNGKSNLELFAPI